MKVLIFGPEKYPDISFTTDPERGLGISTKKNYLLSYRELNNIRWKDLISAVRPKLVKFHPRINPKESWGELKEKLIPIAKTAAERYFLKGYLELCDSDSMDGEPLPYQEALEMPALIPQVWLNWTHYDSRDKDRSEKVKKEPQRVDFLMYYGGRWIVIEIDGQSHFSDILDVGETGKIKLEGSMERYTEHLRKDRWLRSQGYEVWRYSDLEILEIEKKIANPNNPSSSGWTWGNAGGYIFEFFNGDIGLDLPVPGIES